MTSPESRNEPIWELVGFSLRTKLWLRKPLQLSNSKKIWEERKKQFCRCTEVITRNRPPLLPTYFYSVSINNFIINENICYCSVILIILFYFFYLYLFFRQNHNLEGKKVFISLHIVHANTYIYDGSTLANNISQSVKVGLALLEAPAPKSLCFLSQMFSGNGRAGWCWFGQSYWDLQFQQGADWSHSQQAGPQIQACQQPGMLNDLYCIK